MKKYINLDLITTIGLTILGITQNQVTVFYIVYLFWFQELVRTIIDILWGIKQHKGFAAQKNYVVQCYGVFFLLFVYLVFIVVLLGVMLNWQDKKLLLQNINVVLMRNWFFNINITFFLMNYIFFRKSNTLRIQVTVFNSRHILLHISIIVGGILQMIIVPRLGLVGEWKSVVVVLPFLLLKYFFSKRDEKALQMK